ncbi:cobyric acid synthase [Bacillus piscicola]|uniref:cobyric acid synthase n=1 Tax=Bacillus piscicola TaxID=1632684 RepID=UPI001F09E0A3|nr:cobyric acid synthase [Bacillus piscicola]
MQGLIVWGTTSDAGKSFIVTGLCRALANRGLKVAPFKGQNMSNNSYVTLSGHEIGIAQGLQAEAARTEATVYMNPVLLKPSSQKSAEVIMLGESYGSPGAAEYRRSYIPEAREAVAKSLKVLAEEYDAIVMEGAGSPAEVNLMDKDIANLITAEIANVPALLAADIERGGIFASISGTLALLPPKQRRRVKGLIVNRFRGDPALFENGVTWLEEHTGVSVNGVLPALDIHMEGEDSLAFSSLARRKEGAGTTIDMAVLSLPYIANHTDIDPFTVEEDVSVRIVKEASQFGTPDVVFIPGTTTSPQESYAYLERLGLTEEIRSHFRQGGAIVGVGNGAQLLGKVEHARNRNEEAQTGLGICPLYSQCQDTKKTSRWTGTFQADGTESRVTGFVIDDSIQHGRFDDSWLPLFVGKENQLEGIRSADNRLIGTSVHHAFHNDWWRTWWLNQLREAKGVPKAEVAPFTTNKDRKLDQLADAFEEHLNIDAILDMIKKGHI